MTVQLRHKCGDSEVERSRGVVGRKMRLTRVRFLKTSRRPDGGGWDGGEHCWREVNKFLHALHTSHSLLIKELESLAY